MEVKEPAANIAAGKLRGGWANGENPNCGCAGHVPATFSMNSQGIPGCRQGLLCSDVLGSKQTKTDVV